MKLWPFHQHRYFEVDREWMEIRWRNMRTGETAPGGRPVTMITERCSDNCCGKYRQQKLVGHLPGGHPARESMPEGKGVPGE